MSDAATAGAMPAKPKMQSYRRHLLVCVGPRCTQNGESQALFDRLGEKFKAAGIDRGELRVKRTRTQCFATCKAGPIVCVQPDGIWYYNVTEANLDRIIREHLVGGRPVEDLIYHPTRDGVPPEADFSVAERAAVYRAIRERRDMRHFRPDPVDPAVLARLLEAAHRAPSVGLMQPWRFVRVTDPALRLNIHALVEEERKRSAQALGERGAEFMRLKLEGIRECGELLVAALMDGRERHIFGRRTLPEMDLASVACAIQNLWLTARAEGLGLGWVSLFDPDALARLLAMPAGARPVAILCLGHVDAFYPAPMLELEGWTRGRAWHEFVFHDTWGNAEPFSVELPGAL